MRPLLTLDHRDFVISYTLRARGSIAIGVALIALVGQPSACWEGESQGHCGRYFDITTWALTRLSFRLPVAVLQHLYSVMRWGFEFITPASAQTNTSPIPPNGQHPINDLNVPWESASMGLPDDPPRLPQDPSTNKDTQQPRAPSRLFPFGAFDLRLSSLGAMLTSRIPFPASQYLAPANVPLSSDVAFSSLSDHNRHTQYQAFNDDRINSQPEALPYSCDALNSLPDPPGPLAGPRYPVLYSDAHVNPVELTTANLLSHAGISVDSNEVGHFNDSSQGISLEASVASSPTYYSGDPFDSIVSSQYATPTTTRNQSAEPGPSFGPLLLSLPAVSSRIGSFSSHDMATCSSATSSESDTSDEATATSGRAASPCGQESSLSDIKNTVADVDDKTPVASETKANDKPLPIVPFKRKGYSFCNVDKSQLVFRYSNHIVIPSLEKGTAIPYKTKTKHDFRHDPTSDEFHSASVAEDESIVAQQSKLGAGDMYTPRFVKTTQAGRFGWCDCGEWLGMKSR